MTTSTTFTWVHACVKDRVLEHLHGVFLIFLVGCGEKGCCVAERGTDRSTGYYILIPIVYTTIFLFMLLQYSSYYYVIRSSLKP